MHTLSEALNIYDLENLGGLKPISKDIGSALYFFRTPFNFLNIAKDPQESIGWYGLYQYLLY